MSTVLTLVETIDGTLARSSGEALTFARDLAADATLHAATVGPPTETVVVELAAAGVEEVHVLHHPLLEAPATAAAVGAALAQLVTAIGTTVVVGAASDHGTPTFAHLAAELDEPLAANCTTAAVVDDHLELTRLRWGGMLYEDARLEAEVALLTVAAHQLEARPASQPGAALLINHEVALPEEVALTRVLDHEAVAGGISLATAPVVVAGGRGVGSAEGFAVLDELAGLLGGAVGCSRVATNAGWRSHNDQVGQTGARVAPDLYIACGISGATQHWVGCMNAKRIMAINTDAEAPMVTRANEAVVGDLHEFLPALVEEVRSRRGS
ncbi:MAG: electron transfer flavoprotein subunit alpha/FixB family protein [Nitriliruptoraceae bacterium]